MKVKNKDLIDLRKKTDIPLMECRDALLQSGGDTKKAEELLSEKAEKIASKKASRLSSQGLIDSYIHLGGKIGVLIEVSCETDFVARNEQFKTFAHDVCMQIAANDPADIDGLLEQLFIKDETIKVKNLLTNLIAKIGEKIEIKRFIRFEIGK